MENTEPTPEKKPRRKVKQAIRKGTIEADANFIQESRVFQKAFTERMADFLLKDPTLDAAFASAWLQQIEDTISHPTDELMKDFIQEKIEHITAFINQAMDYVTDLEYYVGKAFPDDERIPFEFAFDLIKKEALNTSPKFLIHCHATIAIATEYSTELLANNLPPNLISDFSTLLDASGVHYINLEIAKRHRIGATTKRVKLYNRLHYYWQKVHRAAPVVYKNQPEVVAIWSRK